MATEDMTIAESALYTQASAVITELTTPGLDPECSIGMLKLLTADKIRSARFALSMAQRRAENNSLAEPDDEAADKWCGWCGSTDPEGGLAWDSDDEDVRLTGDPAAAIPAWFCKALAACIRRRRRRYPAGDTSRERLALEQAKAQAQPAILALTAYTIVTRAWASTAAAVARAAVPAQEGTLRLTALGSSSQPRPEPPPPAFPKWAHTMAGNPANRAWTEGARRARLSR